MTVNKQMRKTMISKAMTKTWLGHECGLKIAAKPDVQLCSCEHAELPQKLVHGPSSILYFLVFKMLQIFHFERKTAEIKVLKSLNREYEYKYYDIYVMETEQIFRHFTEI
ncbi:hypothetical protein CsSME_00045111 [Camellia sinensis var. sinensis]